jgi:hypothetical protein
MQNIILDLSGGHVAHVSEFFIFLEQQIETDPCSSCKPKCSARDWDGKDYLRLIPRVVW